MSTVFFMLNTAVCLPQRDESSTGLKSSRLPEETSNRPYLVLFNLFSSGSNTFPSDLNDCHPSCPIDYWFCGCPNRLISSWQIRNQCTCLRTDRSMTKREDEAGLPFLDFSFPILFERRRLTETCGLHRTFSLHLSHHMMCNTITSQPGSCIHMQGNHGL